VDKMDFEELCSRIITPKEFHLIALGETMLRITIPINVHLEDTEYAKISTAGAESNVAIGLAKLGLKTGWVGKVGSGSIGVRILKDIRSWNVDTSQVVVDKELHSGLYIWENARQSVYYFRKIYAGANISPEDISVDYFLKTNIFFTTGITLGLSESAYQTVLKIVKLIKNEGIAVAFDTNYRNKLWETSASCPLCGSHLKKRDIAHVYDNFLRYCDIAILSVSDAEKIWSFNDKTDELGAFVLNKGPSVVIIKSKDKTYGYYKYHNKINSIHVDVREVPLWMIRDKVGAGDAFTVGLLYILLTQKNIVSKSRFNDYGTLLKHAIEVGHATAAYGLNKIGDVQSLPLLTDLISYFKGEYGIIKR